MNLRQDEFDALLTESRGRALDLSALERIDLSPAAVLLAYLSTGGSWIPPRPLVVRSWLRRVGFNAALAQEAPPEGDTDTLLVFTRIESDADVAALLDRVQLRAPKYLGEILGFSKTDSARFVMTLAELCHNIPEHAAGPGWVAIHRYRFRGRNILKLAVADAGRGVRASYGDRYATDIEAIRAAFEEHRSRHDDPGRGHGLKQVVKFAKDFGAKITVRSGTAKNAHVPEGHLGWQNAAGLANVPGTQVLMAVPAR